MSEGFVNDSPAPLVIVAGVLLDGGADIMKLAEFNVWFI